MEILLPVYSTGALEFGLEKKCRKLIFSVYISGLPLIENLMSPQKSPLRVLHNLHINYIDEEINHLALLVYYFDAQIHIYRFNDVFSVNQ